MKNSLFKRVAAAAAAVPLALTQCLTFSSAAAGIDAVQVEGNKIQADGPKEVTLETLTKVSFDEKNLDKPQVSNWNSAINSALIEAINSTGEIDAKQYAKTLADKSGEISKTIGTFLEEYVLAEPVKYEIKENTDIVFTITITQPDWNEKLAYTPEEALVKLAEQYGLPELESVDFSSVKLSGTVEVTLKTSKLERGTDVPVSVVFKPDGEAEFSLGEFPEYGQSKIDALRKLGEEAIEKNFVGVYADKKDQALKDFNANIDRIQNKFDTLNKKMDNALSVTNKNGSYDTLSEAITAANNFLAKKNIQKKIPSSAKEIAAKKAFQDALTQGIDIVAKNAKGTNVKITADEIGAFVDSIGSRTLTEADGTVRATAFNITVTPGSATLVGAFDDDQQADIKKAVEKNGFEYIGSYKKITSKINFSGINTVDIGDVDVQIERVLITNTTSTTTTTTAPVTDENGSTIASTTTTVDEKTSTTTDDKSTTTTDEKSTTTTTAPVTDENGSTIASTTTTVDGKTTTTTDDKSTTTTTSGKDEDDKSTTTTTVTDEDDDKSTTTTTVTDEEDESTTTTTVTDEDDESTTTTTVTDEDDESTTTTTVTDEDDESTTTTTVTDDDESTTTTTGDESTTTTTGDDQTTTTTTGDNESTTTTTTGTVPPGVVTSSVVETIYVEIETTHGFYLNTEAAFDKSQIKKATLFVVYGIGYKNGDETVIMSEKKEDKDITEFIGFGSATPGTVYNKDNTQFVYDVKLTYEGETITDKEGNQILAKGAYMTGKDGNPNTAEVYIGCKGDINLDNVIDARDATATLTYYARISTSQDKSVEEKLSPNDAAVPTAQHVMDDFAAFLTDAKWDTTEKHDRTTDKTDRVVDARDASAILTYYALTSVAENQDKTPAELWAKVLGSQD